MLEIVIAALLHFYPSIDHPTAELHASAALAAEEETGVPATLLLGIGYVESHYDPRWFSRVECKDGACSRVIGIWPSKRKPRKARPTYYCGALQVGGYISWKRCLELRDDVFQNYVVGARHLQEWLADPKCAWQKDEQKRLVCALRGYNGGYKSIAGKAKRYPAKVLRARTRLERLIDHAPNS